jgi:hypothetical protein
MDFGFLAKRLLVLPNHAHFLATQTRPGEERIFVLLAVGSKGVLVKHHHYRLTGARFGELRKFLSDSRDQAGLLLHECVIGHRAMRIADPES